MPRLYIDIGKNTGWCLAPMPAPNGAVHGWADMKQSRFESAGVRWLNFLRLLDRMETEHGIEEVIYEEVRNHRGVDAAHAYGGYIAHLQSWCLQRGIRYRTITVQAAKKAATGKGNADKAAVVAAVKAKGYAVKNENEADAVAIMLADVLERSPR